MRYYSRYSYGGRFLGGDYPVVKMLLLINAAMFLLQQIMGMSEIGQIVEYHLVLSPAVWKGEVWQLVTYMFLHGGVWHILFNMLALWMFGKELEMTWGSKMFLRYYLLCGIGGGLTYLIFSEGYVYGASGAVFGILLAFGMTFPDQIILMSFLFPIKAKYMVMIYGVITFMNIARPAGDNVAHFAHLGGMIFGFFYLRGGWMKKLILRAMPTPGPKSEKKKMTFRPKDGREPDRDMRQRVDAILDKINEVGYDKLTDEEKRILMDASQNLSGKNH